MPPVTAAATRPLYVLGDTSGSTVRAEVNAGWNLAQPHLVTLIEAADPHRRICLATYGDDAAVVVPLIEAAHLLMIPWMPPAGLSSMAAGLALLARTIEDDRRQLRNDRLPVGRAVILVVADGLPTDAQEDLREARAALRDELGSLHVVIPPDADPAELATLAARVHTLRTGEAAGVAESIVDAARRAVAGDDDTDR